MPNDAPFNPPQKKRSAIWWIAAAFVVLVLVFLLQLFGPSPNIIVSTETTYITSPLRADGLPDYEAYVRALSRDGVTPSNNAAALIWPALWPGELSPRDYAPISAELGLDGIPSKTAAAVPIYKAILANLPDYAAEKLMDQVIRRPWTGEEYPALAKWVQQNKKPLDMLVAGSQRPRCYFPSPSYLDQHEDTLVMTLLPGPQSARGGPIARVRAMWHAGEHRIGEAWQDLFAMHCIGRLIAQGPTLVEQLVGMAIGSMACDGTVAMLHESKPSSAEARQVLNDLTALPHYAGCADAMDHMERVLHLDAVIALSRGQLDGATLHMIGEDPHAVYVHHFRIDWNAILSKSNEVFDRLVAAARMKDRAARQQAIDKLEAELVQMDRGMSTGTVFAAAINPAVRRDMVASRLIAEFLPGFHSALSAEDRANATFDLARLAAALAVFRTEQGAYPATLDELVPGVRAELPVDPYSSRPFIYKPIADGYLLYTTGENGRDDGGSNAQLNIYEGTPADELNNNEASAAEKNQSKDSDDISIRVPRPPLTPRNKRDER